MAYKRQRQIEQPTDDRGGDDGRYGGEHGNSPCIVHNFADIHIEAGLENQHRQENIKQQLRGKNQVIQKTKNSTSLLMFNHEAPILPIHKECLKN